MASSPTPWSKPREVEWSNRTWRDLRGNGKIMTITADPSGYGPAVAMVYGDNDEQEAANARLIVTAVNERATLLATNAALVKALGECVERFKRCVISGGTDEEYAEIAVAEYRALLASEKV